MSHWSVLQFVSQNWKRCHLVKTFIADRNYFLISTWVSYLINVYLSSGGKCIVHSTSSWITRNTCRYNAFTVSRLNFFRSKFVGFLYLERIEYFYHEVRFWRVLLVHQTPRRIWSGISGTPILTVQDRLNQLLFHPTP